MPFRLVRTSAAQALVEVEKLLKSMPACVQARLRFAAKPWAKLAIGAATASRALLKVLADQLTAFWNERAPELKALPIEDVNEFQAPPMLLPMSPSASCPVGSDNVVGLPPVYM